MDRRRIIIFGVVSAVIIVLLLILLGCVSRGKNKPKKEDGGPITLTYWRPFDEKEVFDPIIEDFQKENPNIKIEYKKIAPYSEYQQKLVEAIASGSGPDLFAIGNTWIPQYQNKLAPADTSQVNPSDYEKAFYPLISKENIIDNKVYGIPYSIDTLALFSNTTLLQQQEVSEAPKTWDELVGRSPNPVTPSDTGQPSLISKLVKRSGNTITQPAIALGTANNVPRGVDILSLMMLQNRTQMVSENKETAIFNQRQKVEGGKELYLGTESAKFYNSFANPSSPNYTWNDQQAFAVNMFAAGKLPLMIGYSYQIPTIERLNPNLRYQINPMLQIGGTDPVNFGSYWTEVVSKTSPHQKEAWKFLIFVSSKDHIRDYTDKVTSVPARKDVGNLGKVQVFAEQAATATNWYKGLPDKSDQIFVELINAMLGGDDAQRALDAAANKQTGLYSELKNQK